jgi:predicted nuclease of predicted toxin-antitoxin system
VKLLFDENLSFRLVREHAAERGFALVSKDTDFYQRSLAYEAPPKVIWLRVGNIPTAAVVSLLRDSRTKLQDFREDPNASFLPLEGPTR